MKFCPYCGKELWDENAAFCAECGKHIPSRSQKEAKPETAEEVDAVNDAGETTAAYNNSSSGYLSVDERENVC